VLNEEQLTLKEISRRMTSLVSSLESLRKYLSRQYAISEPSPGLQSAMAATLELASLMMAGLAVSQSEMDRLYWTRDSAPLQSLKEHWRIASESLSEWAELSLPLFLADQDCDCPD